MKKIIFSILFCITILFSAFSQEGCFEVTLDGGDYYCSNEYFEIYSFFTSSTSNPTYEWKQNGVIIGTNDILGISLENTTTTIQSFTIIVSGNSNMGCVDEDTVVVNIFPHPTISIEARNVTCPVITGVTPDGALMVSSNEFITSVNYKPTIATSYNYSSTDTINDLEPGTYLTYITGENDCNSDTLTTQITNPPAFLVSGYNVLDDNCSQGTGEISFTGLSGGTKPYRFYDGDPPITFFSSSNDSTIVGLSQLKYGLILLDTNNCVFEIVSETDSIQVTSNSNLAPGSAEYMNAYTSCEGDSLLLINLDQGSKPFPHYYYFSGNQVSDKFSASGSVYLTPLEASQDSVYVIVKGNIGTNSEGCVSQMFRVDLNQEFCESETDSLDNEVTTNAFMPTSDIIENSVFIIDLDDVNNGVENIVTVYNRWGDIVFKRENYNNVEVVWHGDNLNGEALPGGTYFYTIEIPSKKIATSNWVYLER